MQNLGLGLHQNAFGGSPRPRSRNKGPILLREGGGERREGEWKEGMGRGGEGRGVEMEGEREGKGKDDLHPTLFLGPGKGAPGMAGLTSKHGTHVRRAPG